MRDCISGVKDTKVIQLLPGRRKHDYYMDNFVDFPSLVEDLDYNAWFETYGGLVLALSHEYFSYMFASRLHFSLITKLR